MLDLILHIKLETMLYIVLPAYNEEEGLEKLLERIRRIAQAFSLDYQLLVINDGSTDHTPLVVESFAKVMPIELINFETNRGITQVFRTGLKRVCELGQEEDICITMDSDNTQNPYVILDILKKLEEPLDMVIASRFEPGGKMVKAPWLRKLLSLGVAWLLKHVIPIPGVRDYSTFYRGYRVGLLKRGFARYGEALIEGYGFSGMADLLIKLSMLTHRIGEVPLVLRYDLKEGGSGMRILRTIWGYLDLIQRHKIYRSRIQYGLNSKPHTGNQKPGTEA
jgi:dolichol-phosphate mannosyltransferase